MLCAGPVQIQRQVVTRSQPEEVCWDIETASAVLSRSPRSRPATGKHVVSGAIVEQRSKLAFSRRSSSRKTEEEVKHV